MARVIIIGAGLTGLSVAYHLEKKGFNDYLIVEKESEPGGLCRSIQQDGFTFDYSGHLIHSSDDYFKSFIDNLFNEHELCNITRKSFTYSHDVLTPYPYQVNLHGLPTEIIVECVEGYINRKKSIRKPKSFQEWVLKYFGQGVGKNFFFPYQSKIFRFDPKKLSPSWTGRFVPATSLRDMLSGALQPNNKEIGYNSSFLYPRLGGIQLLVSRLIRGINKTILTNCGVTSIDLEKKVISFSNGDSTTFDILINTMPLDNLLRMIKDKSSTNLSKVADNLLCTSVACLNLGIKKEINADKHWVYFPEKKYPFYRLGSYHAFTSSMAPQGCSSLYVECSYRNKKERSVRNLIDSCYRNVKSLFNISDDDIATRSVVNLKHAYVVYDFWRDRNLEKLLHRLQSEDVYSIGRYGAWKYSSMQEAILEGKEVAEKVVVLPARTSRPSVKSHKEKRSYGEKSVTV